MKVLYFDCFSGISGDMALGAMIDLGIDKELFKSELTRLNLQGYDVVIQKILKNGISGTDVRVIIHDDSGKPAQKHKPRQPGLKVSRRDAHDDHKTDDHHTARNLNSIETLIDSSDLGLKVKEFSRKVFREIAGAEAKVHGKDISDVHFHEVGAIDSIIDIVGAGICMEMLGIDKVYSSPIHDGHGFIECQHGVLPVPVPAVMEMLVESGIPYVCDDVKTELVTPTGLGLIKCLASDYGCLPEMMIDGVGYGFGKRETGRFNALRVTLGTVAARDAGNGEIVELETNIDDMNPEIIGFTIEQLLQNGALDVYSTPISMKKSRPAVKLTVLAKPEDEGKMKHILFSETSTLGIRRTLKQRFCLEREIVAVPTPYGDIRVKVATMGDVKKLSPEYEDCKSAARKHGVPLSKIYYVVAESAKHLL